MSGLVGYCREVIVRRGRGEAAVKERSSFCTSWPLSLLLPVRICCLRLAKYSPTSSSLRLI